MPTGDLTDLHHVLAPRVYALRERVQRMIPPRFRAQITADDVLQDVWMAAYRTINDVKFENPAAVDHWLARIASNKLCDALRQARRPKHGGDRKFVQNSPRRLTSCADLFARLRSPGRTPSQDVHWIEAAHTMTMLLNALSDDRRRAIELRYLDGLSNEAVARKIGKTVAAVNSLLFQARRQLRELMGASAGYYSDARSSDEA